MFTAADVAARLAVSVRFVYDLAARGDVPSYRFGGAVLFDVADIDTYVRSCRSSARPVVPLPSSRKPDEFRARGATAVWRLRPSPWA